MSLKRSPRFIVTERDLLSLVDKGIISRFQQEQTLHYLKTSLKTKRKKAFNYILIVLGIPVFGGILVWFFV